MSASSIQSKRGLQLAGAILAVQDGDTLTVLHQDRALRVRLSGLDCPEEGRGRYGRLLATLLLADGRN